MPQFQQKNPTGSHWLPDYTPQSILSACSNTDVDHDTDNNPEKVLENGFEMSLKVLEFALSLKLQTLLETVTLSDLEVFP